MAASILSLLAVVASVAWWYIRWQLRRRSDPIQIHRDTYAQIDKEIAQKDNANASVSSVSELDELDRLQIRKGNSQR